MAESLSSSAALIAWSLDAHTLLRVEHECPGEHQFREDRPLRAGGDIMSPEVSRCLAYVSLLPHLEQSRGKGQGEEACPP